MQTSDDLLVIFDQILQGNMLYGEFIEKSLISENAKWKRFYFPIEANDFIKKKKKVIFFGLVNGILHFLVQKEKYFEFQKYHNYGLFSISFKNFREELKKQYLNDDLEENIVYFKETILEIKNVAIPSEFLKIPRNFCSNISNDEPPVYFDPLNKSIVNLRPTSLF